MPTNRDEEWRFTDLAPLNRLQSLVPADAAATVDVSPFVLPEAAVRLTFVDGVYAPALSQRGAQSAGVTAGTLSEGLKSNSPLIEAHLTKHAGFEQQLFTALNTAWCVTVPGCTWPKTRQFRRPIHLLFIATRKDAATSPRVLVVAGQWGRMHDH